MDIKVRKEELEKSLEELNNAIKEAQEFLQVKITERERHLGALAIINDLDENSESVVETKTETVKSDKK